MEAYLDIETTGLSRHEAALTVVGIAVADGDQVRVDQPFGDAVTADRVMACLHGVDTLYTYNGSRFDLPFIQTQLRLDLHRYVRHVDLMYGCWRHNLKGGLKAVERQLGITRTLQDVDGRMAVWLWWDYVNNGNEQSLQTLLAYNREDILNLPILRARLGLA